ncbi:MAG: hypothetical protein J6M62_03090 [Selenomonadaceae bacterium]|nr:hypothetical protein [Selenomonadaceae bacterium]
MSRKQRVLTCLHEIEAKLLKAAKTGSKKSAADLMRNLAATRDVCREGLYENSYVKYGEIFDGLILTVEQMTKVKELRSNKEAFSLSNELLQYIIRETEQETNFKKDVFFLPYKASMWDSLESVWKAAYEDKEHCNAYVMPIPYADLNPDGSVATWHSERDQFPKYVPTLDWKEIDLKVLRPDVIFIHNPYDNFNRVTSVESRYYSSKLKECADKLVYVPYFVTGRRWPESHIALSAYRYMDFIIMQQEHMQIAPMHLSNINEGEEPYFDDFVPKEKIMALGSPKIDRIYYCEKHPQVPQEWLDYIGDRKVIFYNTSISGALQQEGRFLNKMRYIFSTFQEHPEVALIWRPHPLLEASLKSMRQNLYEEYIKLKELYISQRIGIYDTTPDLEMTMAVSDAYLGESSSSVVGLFGYAGKPIFFTNDYFLWNEPSLEERAALQIGAHIVEKDMKHSYFLAVHYNRFCRMNWETGEIETLLDFGNTPDSKRYSTFFRDEDDGKFYFSPDSAKSICIYDATTGDRRDIPYENPLEGGNFGGIIKYEHYLYFLPSRYQAIMRLNQHTGEITYYRECLEEILPTVTAQHMQLLGGTAWLKYPNLIYIAALQSNKVMTFDMETGEYSWQKVGPEDTDCCAIVEESYGSGVFWLFPWRTEKIRRWDTHTGECVTLGTEDYPEGYECQTDWWDLESQYKFSCIVRLDGYIYLLPRYGNMAMRLNMAERKLEKVDLALPFGLDESKSNYFMQQSPISSVGGLFLPGRRPWDEDLSSWALQFTIDNRLYWYDFRALTYKEIPCRLTDEQAKSWPTSIGKSFERFGKDIPYATGENRACRSVSQFIEYIAGGEHNRDKQRRVWSELAKNIDGTCGEKVMNEILGRLG